MPVCAIIFTTHQHLSNNRMFTHDALEVKLYCDSTPLRSEGKFPTQL